MSTTPANPQPCPPRTDLCPACGELHTYICGRSLLERDPAKKEEACLDGLFICADCVGGFKEFVDKTYDARARRKEWEID